MGGIPAEGKQKQKHTWRQGRGERRGEKGKGAPFKDLKAVESPGGILRRERRVYLNDW